MADEKVKTLTASLSEKEGDLRDFIARLDTATKSLDKAKGTQDELRGQKETLEKRNTELAEKLEVAKKTVLDLEAALDKLSEDLLPLRQFQLEKDAILAAARKEAVEEFKKSEEYHLQRGCR